MHLIVYTSELTAPSENINILLKCIVEHAAVKNAQSDITGLLFYHNSRFLQFIEGHQAALDTLMQTMSKDPRHKNIVRIIDETVPERSFSDWAMDSFNLNNNDVISLEELNAVRDVYRKYANVIPGALANFYKHMLASQKNTNS